MSKFSKIIIVLNIVRNNLRGSVFTSVYICVKCFSHRLTQKRTQINTKTNYALSLLFLVSIFYFLFSNEMVLAQTEIGVGIEVKPAIVEENVDPGQDFPFMLHFTNINATPRVFYVVKRDISGLTGEGNPIFAEVGEKTGYELSSWIEATSAPILMGPNETKDVSFIIKVPQNAPPGGHFGGIFFSPEPESQMKTIGSLINYAVVPIIRLRVSGEIFEEARIRDFFSDKTIYSKPDASFTTHVENLGNVLIKPRGPIDITNLFGKKVATIIMNNSAASVFPRDSREFKVSWQKDGIAFGRYEAIMSLAYGQEPERKTISAMTSFWILPLNIILPVFGGILFLILAIFIFTKIYIKRKMKQILKATQEARGQQGEAPAEEKEIMLPRADMPFPKIAVFAIGLLVFILVFLVVLFFLFA